MWYHKLIHTVKVKRKGNTNMNLPVLRRVAITTSAFALLAAFVVAPVLAQTQQSGNGFRISPVRSELTIEKGKSETLTLTLENPADAPTTARPVVNDFVASDKEDGEPRLILDDTAEAPKNSFKALVQPLQDVKLGAREKKEITVAIKVPENANAGGYYGAVRFVPLSQESGPGNVGLTASVGTIVLVRVPGDLIERLDLLELTAGQNGKAKSFITSGDVSVITRLKNEGDIHVKPFGKLVVKNMFGKVVYEGEFNAGDTEDSRANVLPGSTRKFENAIGKKSLLGRYTIEANLGFSQGSGDLISAKTSFWYLPVWALVVLLLIVVALVGGGYVLYRKFTLGKPRHGVKK
jgi:hypothetical protein